MGAACVRQKTTPKFNSTNPVQPVSFRQNSKKHKEDKESEYTKAITQKLHENVPNLSLTERKKSVTTKVVQFPSKLGSFASKQGNIDDLIQRRNWSLPNIKYVRNELPRGHGCTIEKIVESSMTQLRSENKENFFKKT